MFKVIKNFTDLQDNNHKYVAGDTFPRDGLTVSPERLEELSTGKNRRGVPMIEKIVEQPVEVEPEKVEEVEPVKKSAPAKKGKKK